jgi:hypothetical protein
VGTRRDILLIAGLFVALILFVVFGPARQPPQEANTPTSHSSAAGGALALHSWAEQMGYRAERLEFRDFALDDGADLLFVLGPSTEITAAEARQTLSWVDGGGTLVLASEQSALFGGSNALLDELGVELAVYTTTVTIEQAGPLQPALGAPPVGPAQVRATRMLIPHRSDYAPLVGTPDALLMLGIRHGQGYIFLSSTVYPFTNEGLADQQNARIVLNMLRRVPSGGRIVFDEYHHGYIRPPPAGGSLVATPFGWAGVYVAAAVAMYLALSGRRFGRPVPLREEIQRRSSAEYVESMADLFLRGGKLAFVRDHYHRQLKRRLARSHGVNPQLDDEQFASELDRSAAIDAAELLVLLRRLRQAADDGALLGALAEADRFLQRHVRPGYGVAGRSVRPNIE